jgi:chaperone required for assembly of F1-ATPase
LLLPSREIAMIIASEWDSQQDSLKGIEPVTMPFMTLIATAIDQIQYNELNQLCETMDSTSLGVSSQKQFVIDNCMRYLPTDSLLFFTNQSDRILLKKQKKYLTPIIKALNRQFGFSIQSTSEMTSKMQHSPETLDKIETLLSRMVS